MAIKVAVVPETVQTGNVVEAKLTGNPEVAADDSESVVPAVWPAIAPKVIVCDSSVNVDC
jgi:hypothetical protein